METIFYPFLLYYWFFGLLLPFWQWVIGGGIILIVVFKLQSHRVILWFSALPSVVRWLAVSIAIIGVLGTMPTSFLYGGIAGEAGANIGRSVDRLLGLTWPVFRVLIGSTVGIISVTGLIAWAIVIWGGIGGVIGFGLDKASRFLWRNQLNVSGK